MTSVAKNQYWWIFKYSTIPHTHWASIVKAQVILSWENWVQVWSFLNPPLDSIFQPVPLIHSIGCIVYLPSMKDKMSTFQDFNHWKRQNYRWAQQIICPHRHVWNLGKFSTMKQCQNIQYVFSPKNVKLFQNFIHFGGDRLPLARFRRKIKS